MAYSDTGSVRSLTRSSSTGPRRSSEQYDEEPLKENEIIQGRIYWLPPKEYLSNRSVRRAHGKGAIEEGIYNHPVVAMSRPVDDEEIVHFHLITSFQGKRLDEIYGKNNEFHASRRSWYLPVSPTPDHPDATSKKAKKRFPTLELHAGASLRWDSYVNLRHVYKIHWSCLRRYPGQGSEGFGTYRFEHESMIRLLSKSKFLTGYEAGEQRHRRSSKEPRKPLGSSKSEQQYADHSLAPQRSMDEDGPFSFPPSRFLDGSPGPYGTGGYSSNEVEDSQEDDNPFQPEQHPRVDSNNIKDTRNSIGWFRGIAIRSLIWAERIIGRLRAWLEKRQPE